MGLSRFLLSIGPNSTDKLTKNVCSAYLEYMKIYPDEIFTRFCIYHSRLTLDAEGIRFIFPYTISASKINISIYSYCYFYVLFTNLKGLKNYHINRRLVSQIIVETINKNLQSAAYSPLDRISMEFIHNSMFLKFVGADPKYIASSSDFYSNFDRIYDYI